MKNLPTIDYIAIILVIVGGLNWGLIGIFDFNLVAALFGEGSFISRVVYTLVGLSAAYVLIIHRALTRARL